MSKCGKCDASIANTDSVAKCNVCKTLFHTVCVRNFTKAKTRSWKCEGCSDESASVSSIEKDCGEDRQWLLHALEDLKSKINTNTDEKILGIQHQLSEFKTQLCEINTRTVKLETSQQQFSDRCNALEQENTKLCSEVRILRDRLADVEQYTRCNNLEIVGIPVTAEEDVYACLEKLADVIKVPYKREDISIAHRLRLYSRKYAFPPIIVQFTSRRVKETWQLAMRHKRSIDTTEIAATLQPGKVFINEHLTGHNKALLGRARRLCREGKLYYAGYVNGKILIKPTEGATAIRVQQMTDMDPFEG